MAGASRLQVRFRGLAAITAVWMMVFGVLAAHHEAAVAHARDSAGGYLHGKALAGHHEGHDADIHGQRNPDADVDGCALLTSFHQAASAHVTAPAIITAMGAAHAQDLPRAALQVIAGAVYRLAPKTSPPAAA